MPPILAADTSRAYHDVAHVFLPVAIAVFAVFAGLIVLLAWRGSRRKEASRRASTFPPLVTFNRMPDAPPTRRVRPRRSRRPRPRVGGS